MDASDFGYPIFSADGKFDALIPSKAKEGDGESALGLGTVLNFAINMTPDMDPALLEMFKFEYVCDDEGYITITIQMGEAPTTVNGYYDNTTGVLTLEFEDQIMVFSRYETIKSVVFDQVYYRAGEIDEELPQTLLFKSNGEVYVDDILQPYKFIKLYNMYVCVPENATENINDLLGQIFISSFDGTYISDMSSNDFYLIDYSHGHIHDEPVLVGSSTIHSRIPCCDIIISEHNFSDEILKYEGLSVNGNTKSTCECGYSYISNQKELNDYTWSEIQELASCANVNLKYIYGVSVGQTKYSCKLIDMSNPYNGWVFSGPFNIKEPMHTNSSTDIHSYHNTTLASKIESHYDSLSNEELKNVIKKVKVKCVNTLDNFVMTEYEYHFFLPSEVEVGSKAFSGTEYYTYLYAEACGETFEAYKDGIRANWLWTRSMDPQSSSVRFLSNTPDEKQTGYSALPDTDWIIAVPIFVVGQQKSLCDEHIWAEYRSSIEIKCENNCLTPRTYYKTCSVCGYISTTETFTVGTTLNPSLHLGHKIYGGTNEIHEKYSCCDLITSDVHTFLKEKILLQPTCLNAGIKELTCSCGYIAQETIPATGHSGSIIYGGTEIAHEKYSICECTYNNNHVYSESHIATVPGFDINGQVICDCECGYYIVISPKTVDDYTWTELQAMSQLRLTNEEYTKIFGLQVGQIKENTYILVDIDGNSYEGFVFMYNTGIEMQMNNGPSNSTSGKQGGYVYADLNKEMHETILNNMYDDLTKREMVEAMKYVSITCTTAANDRPYWQTAGVYMFAPSIKELGWVNSQPEYDVVAMNMNNEGQIFDYFIEGNDEAAQQLRVNIGGDWWWSRTYSDYYLSGGHFYAVSDGSVNSVTFDTSEVTVVACFVIG